MMIKVIKVGGAIVEDPASLEVLLNEFVKLEGPKVLVHGGGRSATKLASQLGIQTQMVGGRRITDAEMLRIVTMVYGGSVNKNIVAALQARGLNALGLTGADMNLIRAHRRPITPEGIDFGFVGDIDGADGKMLVGLIEMGITPVIAPLAHDGEGHLLNVNADTIAQTVATALAPLTDVELTYCFELPGVMQNPEDAASLIPNINGETYRQLLEKGIISGGMIPKMDNAFKAIHEGVSKVIITQASNLTGGTTITE